MFQNGIRRSFKPGDWERGTPKLVFGELLALLAAILGAALPDFRWLLSAGAIMGAGALFWYALDKSSLGEMPLTGASARRILTVVNLERQAAMTGIEPDLDTISGDGSSVIADFSNMKPELKAGLAEAVVRQQLQKENPEWTQQDMDGIVGRIPASVRLELADKMLGRMPLTIEPEA